MPEPGNPQDLNRYAYTRNNPVLYRDPTGHVYESGAYGEHYGLGVGPMWPVEILWSCDDCLQNMQREFTRYHEPRPCDTGPGTEPVDVEKAIGYDALNIGADTLSVGVDWIGMSMEATGGLLGTAAYAASLDKVDTALGAISFFAVLQSDRYWGYTYIDQDDTLYDGIPELVIGRNTVIDVVANFSNALWPEATGDFLVNAFELQTQAIKFAYTTTEPTWETRVTLTGIYVVKYQDGYQSYIPLY